jgi:hypothetical protein
LLIKCNLLENSKEDTMQIKIRKLAKWGKKRQNKGTKNNILKTMGAMGYKKTTCTVDSLTRMSPVLTKS